MIIDSSALVAILLLEGETTTFIQAIDASPIRWIAAPTYLETAIAMTNRKGPAALRDVEDFVSEMKIEIRPFIAEASRVSAEAFLTYGKSRGHPAQLNFGDCIAYAASKIEAMPLLFKGDDFRHTDVECAV